jgi:hypothetical protein
MTASHPGAAVFGWASAILGGQVTVLRVADAKHHVRVGTEVAAMRCATAGLPAPKVFGHDDSTTTGVALFLTSVLPGTSQILAEADARRLRALGAIAARIGAVDLEPSACGLRR